jgi:hypothetical protein
MVLPLQAAAADERALRPVISRCGTNQQLL